MTIQQIRIQLGFADALRTAADGLSVEEMIQKKTGGSFMEQVCICGARWDHWEPRSDASKKHAEDCPRKAIEAMALKIERRLSRLTEVSPV